MMPTLRAGRLPLPQRTLIDLVISEYVAWQQSPRRGCRDQCGQLVNEKLATLSIE